MKYRGTVVRTGWATAIVLLLAFCSLGRAEEDEIRALLSEEFMMETSVGIRIEVPPLERKLKTATHEFWIKGLTDDRTIDSILDDPTGTKSRQEEKGERDDWRVKDIFYYFYFRIRQPEGLLRFEKRTPRRARDEAIQLLVKKLTDARETESNAR